MINDWKRHHSFPVLEFPVTHSIDLEIFKLKDLKQSKTITQPPPSLTPPSRLPHSPSTSSSLRHYTYVVISDPSTTQLFRVPSLIPSQCPCLSPLILIGSFIVPSYFHRLLHLFLCFCRHHHLPTQIPQNTSPFISILSYLFSTLLPFPPLHALPPQITYTSPPSPFGFCSIVSIPNLYHPPFFSF